MVLSAHDAGRPPFYRDAEPFFLSFLVILSPVLFCVESSSGRQNLWFPFSSFRPNSFPLGSCAVRQSSPSHLLFSARFAPPLRDHKVDPASNVSAFLIFVKFARLFRK